MNKLPMEIVWEIFEELGYKDQVSLYRTNRKFFNCYRELNSKENVKINWRIQIETEKYYPNRNFYTMEFEKKRREGITEKGIILEEGMTRRLFNGIRGNNLWRENEEEIKKEFRYKKVEVLQIHKKKWSVIIKFTTDI